MRKTKWKTFFQILWPSHNIWTLATLIFFSYFDAGFRHTAFTLTRSFHNDKRILTTTCQGLGRIFLWKLLTCLTKIVISQSSWDNIHYCVHFYHFQKMMILSLKIFLSEEKFISSFKIIILWKCLVVCTYIFPKWTQWWLLSQLNSLLHSRVWPKLYFWH